LHVNFGYTDLQGAVNEKSGYPRSSKTSVQRFFGGVRSREPKPNKRVPWRGGDQGSSANAGSGGEKKNPWEKKKKKKKFDPRV